MTYSQFQCLLPRAQLLVVLLKGVYLVRRRNSKRGGIYYLTEEAGSFFAEVGFDEGQGCYVVRGSFRSSVPLEDSVYLRPAAGTTKKALASKVEAF